MNFHSLKIGLAVCLFVILLYGGVSSCFSYDYLDHRNMAKHVVYKLDWIFSFHLYLCTPPTYSYHSIGTNLELKYFLSFDWLMKWFLLTTVILFYFCLHHQVTRTEYWLSKWFSEILLFSQIMHQNSFKPLIRDWMSANFRGQLMRSNMEKNNI